MLLCVAVIFLVIASNPRVIDGAATLKDVKSYDNIDVHESCKSQTFCTIKPADYPQEEIDYILQNQKNLLQLYPIQELPRQKRMSVDLPENSCQSEVKYMDPSAVKGSDGIWRTVLQSPETGFSQRIRTEICTNPGASCGDVNVFMGKISCKQFFTDMQISVLKGLNETRTTVVQLPTACSCSYMRDYSF